MPPFPYPHENMPSKEIEGIPIYNLNDENPLRDSLHPSGLMHGTAPDNDGVDQKCMVSCDSYLLEASGVGDSVQEAKERAYEAVESVEIPNSPEYRTDISDRLKKDVEFLQKLGYAETWKY
jgi:phosphoribosylamine-glycine ligase